MTALALLGLLLTGATGDGGTADVLPVEQLYERCPSDAPFVEPIDGGYFTPTARAERQVCRQAACEAYANTKLTETQSPTPQLPTMLLLLGAGVSLLAAGIVIGAVADGWRP